MACRTQPSHLVYHFGQTDVAQGRVTCGVPYSIAYVPPQSHVDLHLLALLSCDGEDTAVTAGETVAGETAIWAAKVLPDDPEKDGFIISTLQELSRDWRLAFAAWLKQQGYDAEVAPMPDGAPLARAFIIGLERQLGCAPSDVTMQALLDDIAAIKSPLGEAQAIIELLRFTPAPSQPMPPTAHDCMIL